MSTCNAIATCFVAIAITVGWPVPLEAQTTFEPRMLDSQGEVAIADFDGDGRNDVASSQSDQLWIHLSTAQGAFAQPTQLALTNISQGYVLSVLVTGDVDGDGDTDLVLATWKCCNNFPLTGELAVLLNTGAGAFIQGTTLAAPSPGLRWLVAEDFDSNGTLDIIATNPTGSVAFIYNGDGAGGWAGQTSLQLPLGVGSLRSADFDGDGDRDLAFVRATGGFAIAINDGGLAFHWAATYIDGSYCNDLALADFDGDGDIDVAYDRSNLTQLALATNDGAGDFAPPMTLPTVGQIFEVATADVDRDGRPDLIATGRSPKTALQVARNLGAGSFTQFVATGITTVNGGGIGSLAIGDLNGDGFVDAASWIPFLSAGIMLSWGDGHGGLGPPRVDFPNGANRIVRADFDGDGRDDFATFGDGYLSVALQPSAGSFTTSTLPMPTTAYSIAAGRFDADSDVDLAATLPNNTVHTFLNDGTGHFGAPLVSPLPDIGRVSVAADINGDGLDDLVIGHSWYQNSWGFMVQGWCGCVLSTGTGTFSTGPTLVASDSYVFEFAVGRFNADARDDIAVTTGSACYVIVSSGATSFTTTTLPGGSLAATGVAACDLDGDGNLDVVSANGWPFQCVTALGDGQGSFSVSAPIPIPGLEMRQFCAGDFDADGDADVAYIDDNATLYLLENKWPSFGPATQRFATATTSRSGMVALDANADGRTDLAVTDPMVPCVRLLLQTKVWEHPDAYCTSKTTSNGCVPAIGWSGVPSAAATSGFTISCASAINNKAGLLFYSLAGRAEIPFQGATLCVRTPPQRTPPRNSGGNSGPNDCSGNFTLDFNAFAHGLAGGSPSPALTTPGIAVTAQWWGRDPGFAPPGSSMLSNALEFVIGP